MPDAAILTAAACLLVFLPFGVFLGRRTLQTRGDRSTWDEGKRWMAITGLFVNLEFPIHLVISRLLEDDLLGGVVSVDALPPWGWTLLAQGIIFGLASALVAWAYHRSVVGWFVGGVLFGPFGLVASIVATDGEEEAAEPESGGSGLCPNCGAHVQWGTGFCAECGYAFDDGGVDGNNDGIPVYTSEGKIGEITGVGKILLLLLVTALAVGSFWGYFHFAWEGHDLYLWGALLGALLGPASVGGWYEALVGPVGGGCRGRLLLVVGIFSVLAVVPVWVHFSEAPSLTVDGTTTRVERTVPPVCMEMDAILQLMGNGTLEHTADALGRAAYRAAAAENAPTQEIIVNLGVPCPQRVPDFVVRDTIRNVAEVRAHGDAAAYARSDHWKTISRPQFVPDAPCNGQPMGLVEGFARLIIVYGVALVLYGWWAIKTFWWALRTGRWGLVAVGGIILLWIYWRMRKEYVQDEPNNV